MPDDEILTAAIEELRALTDGKPWITERGLAKRLRRRPLLNGFDHIRLRNVLMGEAAKRPRRLRNSRLPSLETLEVLWGVIRMGGIREENNPLPIRTDGRVHFDTPLLSGRAEFDEEEEAADYFLSYRMADEAYTREVIRTIESKGFSVWDAGTFIVDGEHINDRVIETLGRVRKQLIYLSDSALSSLWVNKEAIHGEHLQLDQTIALKGDDDSLMEYVYQMLEGKTPHHDPFRGAYLTAAVKFKEILQAELTNGDSSIFLYPMPASERWRRYERLKPISDFPIRGEYSNLGSMTPQQ